MKRSQVRIGSLFSGYGGLDTAVMAVMGGETAWVSDIDPGACKVLAHRYPNAPNLGDVSAIDWTTIASVDVLAAGFPCTDISSDGKKAGIDDGKASGLWREVVAAVRALRPGLVVVENVADLLGRGFGRVVGDLAAAGYDASWTCVPACGVGAPFRRDRVFLLAAPTGAYQDGFGWITQPDRRLPETRRPVGRHWHHAHRLAVAEERLLDRWADVVGRPAPDPLEWGVNGQPRIAAGFQEWLMGLPSGWVTDVPDLGRTEAMRLLGNGVVPQQAEAAMRWLLTREGAA